MATKPKTAAPAPAPAPAVDDTASDADVLTREGDEPAPVAAPSHPPITAYQSVWVHKNGVALAGNQVGFVMVLKTVAQTMIANGDAVDPNVTMDLPYIEGTKTPPVPPVTVAITAFSAENPTVCTASASDVAKLKAGDNVKVRQTGGTTIAALDGKTAAVGAPSGTAFTLALDLSAADVTSVTGVGTVQAPAPAPAPVAAPAAPDAAADAQPASGDAPTATTSG
jgi:hypothetical protein